MIRDAWQLGDDRPLILAGGPKAVYEPWDFFGLSPDGREGADVVVTGEEYVLLELLDRIVEMKRPGDTMRAAFERLRDGGLLEDIPGLVYRPDAPDGPPQYLGEHGRAATGSRPRRVAVATGCHGAVRASTPPRHVVLSAAPGRTVGRHAKILAMVTTHGCQFHCPYCPIPGYNQFTFRHRSPQRMVEEIAGVAELCGISTFFGTDDNFFSRRETAEATLVAMARGKVGNKPFRKAINFATEATEFDVLKNQDLLPLARDAGMRGLWLGIEDLTGGLVKKGQTVEKTKTLFKLLVKQGIAPMPMMMHHDGQPLVDVAQFVRPAQPGAIPLEGRCGVLPGNTVDALGGQSGLRTAVPRRPRAEQGWWTADRAVPIRWQSLPRHERRPSVATADQYARQLRRVLQPTQPLACHTAVRQGVG